jgi:hypothetical protein
MHSVAGITGIEMPVDSGHLVLSTVNPVPPARLPRALTIPAWRLAVALGLRP